MKPTSFLTLASVFLAGAMVSSADTVWLRGICEATGWSDFNKSSSYQDDDELCWAAAASNVIDWWQKQYRVPDATPVGEAIWDTFKEMVVMDAGGSSLSAFQWWLTGIYNPTNKTEQARGYWGLNTGSAIALENDSIPHGYYYDEYPNINNYIYPGQEGSALSRFLTREDGHTITAETIDAKLRAGSAVTLSLSSLGGSKKLAHSVTLWGVDYELSGGAMTISRLWLTDADDAQYGFNVDNGLFSVGVERNKVGDGTGNYFYSFVAKDKDWYSDDYGTIYVESFSFYNSSESDTWGMPLVPEPATATCSLLALAAMLARRRR